MPRKPFVGNRTKRADRNDEGFVLVMLGLLIIPIVAFTALAVDVSSWYSRATELQRSADAAALAGVVWMPTLSDAQTNADEVLASNGIISGTGDITVSVQQGSEQNSLKVCVTDHSAAEFFGAIISGPETLTRCGTAQYNLPLELGSPLNYYGGNATANFGSTQVVTGQHSQVFSTPANTSDPELPDNYNTATSGTPASLHGCKYVRSSSGGNSYGFWWNAAGARTGATNYKLNTAVVWTTTSGRRTTNHYATELPNCLWTRMVDDTTNVPNNPIPTSKSPNFWAAIAGPGMTAPNGDAYAPRCSSAGNCSSNDNTMYRPSGYVYSIDVPSGTTSGNLSVQIFDATMSASGSSARPTGDTRYGGSTNQHTKFTVMDAGTTPYDTGDDTLVPGCSLTTQGPDASYDSLWVQLCSFTPVVGQRYYIDVVSTQPATDTDPAWGTNGNTYNGYALRVVAGSFPSSCLSNTLPQRNNVDCYGASPQPRLSGYGDMEMYNGIPSGVPTQFFIANVKNVYKGKTFVIELWDPGDMSCDTGRTDCTGVNSYITVMKPGTTTAGTAQLGCTWASHHPNGSAADSGTIGATSQCKIQTTKDGGNGFQNEWLQIRISLPDTYSCSETVDPTTTGGSCWWQILYNVTGSYSLSDYTTWTARIEGDPVRLIQ